MYKNFDVIWSWIFKNKMHWVLLLMFMVWMMNDGRGRKGKIDEVREKEIKITKIIVF